MKLNLIKQASVAVLVIGAIVVFIFFVPYLPFHAGLKSIHGEFSYCPEFEGNDFYRALDIVLSDENVWHIKCGDRMYVSLSLGMDKAMVSLYSNRAIARAEHDNPNYKPPDNRIYMPTEVFLEKTTNILDLSKTNLKSTSALTN